MPPREPIFIVGVQRSGTTLLSAMLAAHSRLSCGPETHFFRRLSKIEPDQILEPESWPENAKKFILSITHTNFSSNARTPLIEKYGLREEDIRRYLNARPPAVSTTLAAITEQYMQKMEKQRWIEKTPDHILHLEAIRQHFPASPIIRIIRDPRAVARSLTKVPWGAESFLHALLTWEKLDRGSERFFSSDPLSYTIYYENLLEAPHRELRNLCAFLGEDFEDQMLDTGSSGKQVNSRNVAWKAKASQPLDPSRTQAWKAELTPFEKKMAEAMIGDRLQAHGYDLYEKFEFIGEFFPQKKLAAKFQKELGDLLGSDTRYWREDSEKASVLVFLGDPSADGWIRASKLSGLWDSVKIAVRFISAKTQKKKIHWVIGADVNEWSGYNALFLKKLLAPYKQSAA